jgi:hypothetical protein
MNQLSSARPACLPAARIFIPLLAGTTLAGAGIFGSVVPAALAQPGVAAGAAAKPPSMAERQTIARLSEEQKITHALNRLAFGPRPEDARRVQAMGLERWIDSNYIRTR